MVLAQNIVCDWVHGGGISVNFIKPVKRLRVLGFYAIELYETHDMSCDIYITIIGYGSLDLLLIGLRLPPILS